MPKTDVVTQQGEDTLKPGAEIREVSADFRPAESETLCKNAKVISSEANVSGVVLNVFNVATALN